MTDERKPLPGAPTNAEHEKTKEEIRAALSSTDEIKVRENLQRVASTPIEVKQMASLADAIKKHVQKPNVITVELLEKAYRADGESLPLNERVAIQQWMNANFDYYNETHVVSHWGSDIVLLVLPPVFNGEYRPLNGDIESDKTLQLYHRDAVDGAYPKYQSIATSRLSEALTRAQMDEEHLAKLKASSIRTYELMNRIRSYLPQDHPSYKAPEENDALKEPGTKTSKEKEQDVSSFMDGEDDLLD